MSDLFGQVDGLTIECPEEDGWVDNVPARAYHRWKPGQSSKLRRGAVDTWRAVKWDIDHPSDKETDSMKMGSALHYLVLEPELEGMVKPAPVGTGKTKAIQALVAANPWVILLNATQWDYVRWARDSVLTHPLAGPIIENAAHKERTGVWTESYEIDGEEVKARWKIRLDLDTPGIGLCDLKFLKDVTERGFEFGIRDHRYDLQDAFYGWGATQLGLDPMHASEFRFICVENHPPFDVQIHPVAGKWPVTAEMQLPILMREYVECQVRDEWPGYPLKEIPVAPHERFLKPIEQWIEERS